MDILDPTHEAKSTDFVPASRVNSLAGTTIGVILNGKKGTKPFFDALERVLGAEGYPFVTIDHPVSSAAFEVLSERVRKAIFEGAAISVGTAACQAATSCSE